MRRESFAASACVRPYLVPLKTRGACGIRAAQDPCAGWIRDDGMVPETKSWHTRMVTGGDRVLVVEAQLEVCLAPGARLGQHPGPVGDAEAPGPDAVRGGGGVGGKLRGGGRCKRGATCRAGPGRGAGVRSAPLGRPRPPRTIWTTRGHRGRAALDTRSVARGLDGGTPRHTPPRYCSPHCPPAPTVNVRWLED